MTKEDIISRLYNQYIKPTENKTESYIGVEIEMPIVNLNYGPVDFDVVHRLTEAFLQEFHFVPTGIDENGHIYAAVRKDNGDVFSYDCSYNNMEFSFGKEKQLHAINDRFEQYYNFVQNYFAPYNYTLTGMGINPYRKLNYNIPIENGRYKMLFNHLSSFPKYTRLPMYFHSYPQFGMFSSASQVQLDVSKENLPLVLNTFNKAEPIKALLFSNSVLLGENEELLCCRDMLWENSTHGINPHNVGMYDCEIHSVEELLQYLSTTSIYCAEREGKYLNFSPINILEYFNSDCLSGEYIENGVVHSMTFKPHDDDIKYLRTFKFEDPTYRGTIEFRSACCQPVSNVMTVSAFHLGLLQKTEALSALLDEDDSLYHNGYQAAELRRQLVCRNLPAYIDQDKLYALTLRVLDLCRDGLQERGFGEKKFILPLYERVEKRTNPARNMTDRLANGESITRIIEDYGSIEGTKIIV